eukprot:COSAG02_NODE_7625_length_2927_cov_14.997171_3_plen_175_part_00
MSRALNSYGLVDRKCGVPMPADNLVCRVVRTRVCLRTPSVRDAAIRQKKAMADATKRLEQVGDVTLDTQSGVGSRHGSVSKPQFSRPLQCGRLPAPPPPPPPPPPKNFWAVSHASLVSSLHACVPCQLNDYLEERDAALDEQSVWRDSGAAPRSTSPTSTPSGDEENVAEEPKL